MRNISTEKLDTIALILKTISHPIRLKIIEVLENTTSASVNDLGEQLGHIEQSLLSHHLIKMKDKGILNSQKVGKYCYYSLKIKELSKMLDCMESCKYE